MIGSLAFRWVLTTVFTLVGSHCLARCAMPGRDSPVRVADRVSAAAHSLMSVVMIAMAWSWPIGWRGLSVGTFGLAAAWFAVRAFWRVDGDTRSGWLESAQHAVAMAGMAWMLMVMPAGAMSGAMSDSGAMAAMAMSSGAGPLSAHDVTVGRTMLGSYFLLATLWWMARAVRHCWSTVPASGAAARVGLFSPGPTIAAHAVMSAAMGMMMLVM